MTTLSYNMIDTAFIIKDVINHVSELNVIAFNKYNEWR